AQGWWWDHLHFHAVGAEVVQLSFLVPHDTPAGLVDQAMVEATVGPQVPFHRWPALGAPDDVVDLEPPALLTAREGAPPVFAQDLAAERAGDRVGDRSVGVLFLAVATHPLCGRVCETGAVSKGRRAVELLVQD